MALTPDPTPDARERGERSRRARSGRGGALGVVHAWTPLPPVNRAPGEELARGGKRRRPAPCWPETTRKRRRIPRVAEVREPWLGQASSAGLPGTPGRERATHRPAAGAVRPSGR